MWRVAILLAGALAGTRLVAQTDLATVIRGGTARYQDQAAAIADGYRKIGPDFPSMGEHWVNAALLVDGMLDPARPEILEYVMIGRRPTLIGVAFAVLTADTTPPVGLPVDPAAWHTHGGTVEQESFVLSHADAVAQRHHRSNGPSVAVLHAWVWLDNPAGFLATDNWAVPFARLGFAVPRDVTANAGRAAALAAGSVPYFATMIRVRARPTAAEQARLEAILASAARRVRAELGRGTGDTVVSPARLAYLETAWTQAWRALLAAASPSVRQRLVALEGR